MGIGLDWLLKKAGMGSRYPSRVSAVRFALYGEDGAMVTRRRWRVSIGVFLAFLLAPALVPDSRASLVAQVSRVGEGFGESRVLGIGYSAVIPEANLGASLFYFPAASRVGFFTDAKMTPRSLRDQPAFVGDVAPADVRDPVLRTTSEWRVLNAGVAVPVSPDFVILLGGGAAHLREILEFVDLAGEFSYLGEDPSRTGWNGNAVLGLLIRGGKEVGFRFGLESAPRKLSVGVYLFLP